MIREVRDTLYDLRTDVSEARTWRATMHDLPRPGAASAAASRSTSSAHETGRLPLLQEREMWRIAQEAVTNVERHAQAPRSRSRGECDGKHAALEVTDDGMGFAIGAPAALDSYGIIGMRERAATHRRHASTSAPARGGGHYASVSYSTPRTPPTEARP